MAIFKNRTEDLKETGFGTRVYEDNQRLLDKEGRSNVRRRGLPFFESFGFYHALITMPWWKFNIIVFLFYFIVNILFASLYYFVGLDQLGGMVGQTPFDKLCEAFFFSAQSLTTVGYGRLNPVGMGASIVAAIESMTGLLGFALATGLLYGKFSRPVAKILYSHNAVIAPYRDMTGFMVRIANKRKNELIDVEASILMSYIVMENGKEVRRFDSLKLEYKKITVLAMTWTIVHPIDETSPMYNMKPEDFKEKKVECLLLINAFDETFSQTVHSRASYRYDEVIYGAKFNPVTDPGPGGSVIISLDRINEITKVEI